MKRTVRSGFAEVFIREEGIVQSRIFPGSTIDIAEAEEYLAMVKYLTKASEHATVIDLSGVRKITPAARSFLQSEPVRSGKTLAVGMVTSSLLSRIMGSFFLRLNRPACPVRMFGDPTEAYAWVKNEYKKALRKKN